MKGTLKLSQSFLFREEDFGGMGLNKENESYFYLSREMIRILVYIKEKGEVKIEELTNRFKINEIEIKNMKNKGMII